MSRDDRALEVEIRAAWRAARAAEPPTWLAGSLGSAIRSTPQQARPRRGLVALAGLAAAVGVVTVGLVFGGGRVAEISGPLPDPTSTPPASSPTPSAPATPSPTPAPTDPGPSPTAAPLLPGAWRRTADPPIGGRAGHVMAWTGTEVLIWGGTESTRETPVFDGDQPRHGATYDPRLDTWGRIPAAPIDGRDLPLAAWTGRELIVWGGWSPSASVADGAAYDPGTQRWRTLPDVPLELSDAVGGWIAGRFVVVTSDGAAAYDPTADAWTALEPAPIRPHWRSAAIAAGRLVVVAFGDGASGVVEGAILDPTRWTWRTIEVPLTALHAGLELRGAGDLAIAAEVGLALDPATGGWSTISACPGFTYGGAWTGSILIGVTAAFEPGTGNCWRLPASPRRAPPFDATSGREFAVGVWTGEAYVTWSGGTGGDIVWVPDDGAVFTPAIDLTDDR